MKRSLSVSLLLISVFLLHSAQGYPNGAPKNRKVCRTLKPRHLGAHPQSSSAPYSITPAKAKVPIGASVNVTISAQKGKSYKGFIMQARPRMRANVEYIRPIGTFKILDATKSKTLDCLSARDNTVTHSSPAVKKSTTFLWTPPPKYKGSVFFRAAFVQDYKTFWVNVSSQIVVGDADTVDLEWLADNLPEEEETSSENDVFQSESLSLSEEIYKECGTSKACFGLPENCVSDSSCDVIASVAAKDSKFEFELIGKNVKYISVILSENGQVNIDSITTCAFVNNSVKLQQISYNTYQVADYQSMNNNEALINSSYVDGVLYCKFLREETMQINSVFYDLKNNQYFLILAAGNMQNEKEIINLDKVQFHVSKRKTLLSDVSGFGASTSNSTSKQTYWFQVKFLNWFFGVFDYFVMLR